MGAPSRDTALVFDLENLVDGYGQGLGARLETISVPNILDQITEAGRARGFICEYAVKRAYADWSKSQLAVLRRVLVEQGIEPRQIFAFGSGGKTNAADVELVIDVLDLAYTRPEITCFVVVSGDGGFGTLVRKLHEFGKTVIVGAYLEKAHKGLRAVADEFVELEPRSDEAGAKGDGAKPRAKRAPAKTATASGGPSRSKPAVKQTRERLRAALVDAYPEPVDKVEDLPAAALSLVQRVAEAPDGQAALANAGIPMGEVVPALADHLDRTTVEAAFGNFTRLMRVALAESPWCVAADPAVPARAYLAARGALPERCEELSALAAPGPVEQFRLQLKARRLVVPEDPADLWAVAEAVAESPIVGEENGEALMERLVQEESLGDIEVAALRQSLILLSKAGCPVGEGSGPFSEWRFRQPHSDLELMVSAVRELVTATGGPDTDPELVDELLGLREEELEEAHDPED